MFLHFHLKSSFSEPFTASLGTHVPFHLNCPSPVDTHLVMFKQTQAETTHTYRLKKSAQRGGSAKNKEKRKGEFLSNVTRCALELNDTSNAPISQKEKESRRHQKRSYTVIIHTRLEYRYARQTKHTPIRFTRAHS